MAPVINSPERHSEDHPFCDWIQRPSKYDIEPPPFDPVVIAAQELATLMARSEQQEDAILTEPEPFAEVDIRWDEHLERRNYVWKHPKTRREYHPLFDKDDRMASSEGIDPVEVYQTAAKKYQDEVTSQGCCWYLFCDIAVFDRTDHVEMPPAPLASDPEPSPAPDKDEDKSEESEFEESEPFEWIYDLGNGSGKKGRAAYSKLPHGKS